MDCGELYFLYVYSSQSLEENRRHIQRSVWKSEMKGPFPEVWAQWWKSMKSGEAPSHQELREALSPSGLNSKEKLPESSKTL